MKFLIFSWKRSTWTSKSLSPQQKPFKSGVDDIFPEFFSGPPKQIEKTEKNHHPGGGHLENLFFSPGREKTRLRRRWWRQKKLWWNVLRRGPGSDQNLAVIGYTTQLHGCFRKWCYPPKIVHFNRVFYYKPSILGYPGTPIFGNTHIGIKIR